MKLVRKFGLAPKYNKILKPLAADAGRVYSKTISTIRKIRKNKGIWLNKNQIAKIARCWQTDLHSQTVQGCFESYFNSLNSFFKRLEKGQAARPPYRTKKYFKLIFKQTAFRIKDDNILELSLRRGLPRLKIKLGKEASDFVRGSQTTYIELIWNKRRQAYDLCVVYPVEVVAVETDKVMAVDLGEIHPVTAFDGERCYLYNGRLLRSLRQYREKLKAKLAALHSRKQRKSKNSYQFSKSKGKQLGKIDRQIKDIEHKITAHFVNLCLELGIGTVVAGDLRGIRKSDCGSKHNQRMSTWPFNRLTDQLKYKCEKAGIKFVLIDERGTSSTCPACASRQKAQGRNFKCRVCGFTHHRDLVGAVNIFKKYREEIPVVGPGMALDGIRYHPDLSCNQKKGGLAA